MHTSKYMDMEQNYLLTQKIVVERIVHSPKMYREIILMEKEEGCLTKHDQTNSTQTWHGVIPNLSTMGN